MGGCGRFRRSISMADDAGEIASLIGEETLEGRKRILGGLFEKHRDRLRLMVQLRLDPLLRARIDPSDILQESYLEAAGRLEEYLRKVPMPVFLWLRRITGQKIHDLHVPVLDSRCP
jgi:RNA polymerase sigma-70 factor, ECF subfamily